MVIYDGKYLNVNIGKNPHYNVILDLAKKDVNSEYLFNSGIYSLTANETNAKALYNAGFIFDDSALAFLKSLRKVKKSEPKKIEKKKSSLFPFQKEGVKKMLRMSGNILLADEMGLGKTVQGAVYLAKKENSLPALIIAPASLKKNWSNEIKKWTGYNSFILEGKNKECFSEKFIKKYPVFIINYDILAFIDADEKKKEMENRKKQKEENEKKKKEIIKNLNDKIKSLKKQIENTTGEFALRSIEDLEEKIDDLKKEIYNVKMRKCKIIKNEIPIHGWFEELQKIKFKTIIADEVQYISDPETIRARAVSSICKKLYTSKKLFISGTPYETRTSQFFTVLNILDAKQFSNRYKYLMKFCDPVKNRYGWKFDGLSNAEELQSMISKFMIRRFKKDVLKDLPPKMRAVVPMSVSESERKSYDLFEEKFDDDVSSGKKSKQELIGFISQLKKKAFEVKSKSVITWIKEYLDSSSKRKLVVFIYHHTAYDLIMKEFGKKAVGITGETPSTKRQDIVDKFQKDKNVELFVGQIKACGAGLTLTEASATCFVEFGMTSVQHEQAEDRVHRIGQKADSVMAYYLILDNSIENDIMDTLNRRNKDLKKLMNNEDDSAIFQTDDFNDLTLESYKNRKKLKK